MAKVSQIQIRALNQLVQMLRVSTVKANTVKLMDMSFQLHLCQHHSISILSTWCRPGHEQDHAIVVNAYLCTQSRLLKFIRIHFFCFYSDLIYSSIMTIKQESDMFEHRWILLCQQ